MKQVPTNKKESIEILNSFKSELTKEQYDNILSNIGTHAIEDMFPDYEDIYNLVQVEKGLITPDEIVNNYLSKWRAN